MPAGALKPTAVLLDCHQAVKGTIAAIPPFLQNIRFHFLKSVFFISELADVKDSSFAEKLFEIPLLALYALISIFTALD